MVLFYLSLSVWANLQLFKKLWLLETQSSFSWFFSEETTKDYPPELEAFLSSF